ncbi:MAG: hypothetical protein ACO2ZP_04935 [Bacteriovoracaceae bacterium]
MFVLSMEQKTRRMYLKEIIGGLIPSITEHEHQAQVFFNKEEAEKLIATKAHILEGFEIREKE